MRSNLPQPLIATFIAAFMLVLLMASLPAAAQDAKSTARLGFLASSSAARDKGRVEAFHLALRDLGWTDGRNLIVEHRFANGQFDTLPALAAELVRQKPDVIVVSGAPAAHAAKNATGVIPVVMTNVADPVGTGLVGSLARPGGNVTGLSDFNAGVVVKRMELLKELVPSARRVAVLMNPGNPTNPLQFKLIVEAAAPLSLRLFPAEVRRPDDIEPAFAAIKKETPDAVVVLGDPLFGSHGRRIVELAMKNRLPSTYGTREWVDLGGLMSYGPSFEELFRRAATYVDKILKGARPGDLPIEQPSRFELVINVSTARRLGLTVPRSLLLRADQVVE